MEKYIPEPHCINCKSFKKLKVGYVGSCYHTHFSKPREIGNPMVNVCILHPIIKKEIEEEINGRKK